MTPEQRAERVYWSLGATGSAGAAGYPFDDEKDIEKIAQAIREAILAEREACAEEALIYARACLETGSSNMAHVSETIAASIRERKKPC